jgi:putative transposase
MNRAVQDLQLFERDSDYEHFLRVLVETSRRIPMRLLAYALMPNHWHLILWPPTDDSLSLFMKRLTATHAQEWRSGRGSIGRGAVYQGRFKAIAVQDDWHFLRLCRYVERNPLRGGLVSSAGDWPWTSACSSVDVMSRPAVCQWPVARPPDWVEQLNTPELPRVLREVRDAIRRGRHFGTSSWREQTARTLTWRGGARGLGRPRGPRQFVDDRGSGQRSIALPGQGMADGAAAGGAKTSRPIFEVDGSVIVGRPPSNIRPDPCGQPGGRSGEVEERAREERFPVGREASDPDARSQGVTQPVRKRADDCARQVGG